jgi:hypothetical protein
VKPDAPNAPRAPQGPIDPVYLKFAGAGLQFALTFLAFGALGWWLDGKLGTEPWLMIGGILAGAAGAMYSLVLRIGKTTPRHSHDKPATHDKPDEPPKSPQP